jgi:deoxyribonucleoside regulator
VHVVQLAGEWSNDSRRSGHDLVRDLAVKLGGRYTYFNAPAFAATTADADALLGEPQVAASLALARAADICVLGVGRFITETTKRFLTQANATDAEIREARENHVVGQLAGRFFDAEGKQVDLAIHRRLVSLDLTDLRTTRTIVVLAAGPAKKAAVEGALRGGLIDVLVCDRDLAEALTG